MNAKNIQEFDKLLKNASSEFNTFDEISEIINNFIKIKIDTTQSDLMQKISQNVEFNSTDNLQKFLNEYFEFHNALIEEFDKVDSIEDNDLFDVEIEKFVKNILKTIEKEKLQDVLLGFIFKIVTTVMSEYSIYLRDDNGENLENLTRAFGNEDVAVLFVGVNIIASYMRENKNIKYNEIVDMSKSIFIFCMAMNALRKNDYNKSQNIQSTVGRNDPCQCGSGRKYKKCCLNQSRPKSLNTINFEEPKNVLPSLSREELHELYIIWSRFLNFVSKAFAGAIGEKYIKIYDKNSKGEFFLTKDAISGPNHYLTIRSFLNEYFFMLVEHFIDDNRVSQKNIDILYEIRDTYKHGRFCSYEMFNNGNAIFYNLENQSCFYAYKTFYNYSKSFPKDEIFEAMFFSYKGRIISDGVAVKHNVEIGENIKKMILEDYKKDRDKLSFLLAINEAPKKNVYQLKISIKGATPPIWRRVLVRPNTTFYGLHSIIQNIFDWENYHLFMFYGASKNYTDMEMMDGDIFENNKEVLASEYKIDVELNNLKDKIKYVYDFGDYWEHEIVLEKILPVDKSLSYPLCTGGKRRGPLEDSGGVWNYNAIVEAIEKPTLENQYILGEDDEQYYEDINSKEFNKELVNNLLRRER